MLRSRWTSLLAICAGLAVSSVAFMPIQGESQNGAPTLKRDINAKLKPYCASCHESEQAPAGVNPFRYAKDSEVPDHADEFQRVIRALKSGAMPPQGMPRPSAAEIKEICNSITILLAHSTTDPGKVTLRRLNRAEYKYTVQDLLGIDFDPTGSFPNDDVGEGFDNIGDVLSVSTLLVEKYLDAAEAVANRAIVTSQPKTQRVEADQIQRGEGATMFADDGLLLAVNGTLKASFDIESAGRYRLKVRASGTQAGPEPVKMAVGVGQNILQQFDVTAKAGASVVYEIPAELDKGKQTVTVSFLNDYYRPEAPEGQRDRNLILGYVEVVGPLGEPNALPTSHRSLIPRKPLPGQELAEARKNLGPFVSKAFRRPVTPEELDRILTVVKAALDRKDSYENAMRAGLEAVLTSPQFLFRPETATKAARPLSSYELATRLSYFLWSSTPDQELLDVARQGGLKDPNILLAQFERMRRDPKSMRLESTFGEQWLQLRKLDNIAPDHTFFPDFKKSTKNLFRTETRLFFLDVLKNDKSVLTFLDSKSTFANDALARIYGWPQGNGPEFREVPIPDNRRGGLLGQGAILMLSSNPSRTSPTKRGRWILEQLLGSGPPPQPPGTPELPVTTAQNQNLSLRERMAAHRTKPECYSCHQLMDPLGFSLEHFDAVGVWRDTEGGRPIDATGELPDGTKVDGLGDLKRVLLSRKDEFVRALAGQMLTFALGRGLRPADTLFLDKIARDTEKGDYKISAMMKAIVLSEPFLKRGAE